MTVRTRRIVGVASALLLLLQFAYLVGSEVYYSRSITLDGILTVRDFFGRFGDPLRVRLIERDGQNYYEFVGHLPPRFVLAAPSAPPAYVFDKEGRFITWCTDPGDTPSHRRIWPLLRTNEVELEVIKATFGLP